ncbi:hypothetical protein FQZ97_1186090 [compost metagenome]
MNARETPVSSIRVTALPSELALRTRMLSFPRLGRRFRSTCGRRINLRRSLLVMPSDIAASVCPGGNRFIAPAKTTAI